MAENLALGKFVVASSQDPLHLGEKVNDGLTNTYWAPNDANASEHSIFIDLGSNGGTIFEFRSIIVRPGDNGSIHYPVDYRIDGSNDTGPSKSWTPLAFMTGGDATDKLIVFQLRTYRFVRLVITAWDGMSPSPPHSQFPAIREFEIYYEEVSQYEKLKRISPGTQMRYEVNAYIVDGAMGSYDGTGNNRYLKTDNNGRLEVVIAGESAEAFTPVVFSSQINGISDLTETTVFSYVVPADTVLLLSGFVGTGDTSAVWTLYIESSLEETYRSSPTSRTIESDLKYPIRLSEGSTIDLKVYHWYDVKTRSFQALLKGALQEL